MRASPAGLSLRAPADPLLARFWWPAVAPLAPDVVAAVVAGARPGPLMPPLAAAASLADPGEWPVETGWTIADGQIRCAQEMAHLAVFLPALRRAATAR